MFGDLSFEGVNGCAQRGLESFSCFFVHNPAAGQVKVDFGDFFSGSGSGVLQFQMNLGFGDAVKKFGQAVEFLLDVGDQLAVHVEMNGFNTNLHKANCVG